MEAAVKNCPICGSGQIKILEPNTLQHRAGAALILKCECGAIVAMTVVKEPKLEAPATGDWQV